MISQPRYLPCLSYLRRIAQADTFIILDNVQMEARGFENRNKLETGNGLKWLSIPVDGSERSLIKNTRYKLFAEDHINKIQGWYRDDVAMLEILTYWWSFRDGGYANDLALSIRWLMWHFGINTNIVLASELTHREGGGVDNLKGLFDAVDGDVYITGATFLEYDRTHPFKEVHIDTWVPDIYPEPEKNYLGWVHYYFKYGYDFVEKQIKS